jgi:hypothetical protein
MPLRTRDFPCIWQRHTTSSLPNPLTPSPSLHLSPLHPRFLLSQRRAFTVCVNSLLACNASLLLQTMFRLDNFLSHNIFAINTKKACSPMTVIIWLILCTVVIITLTLRDTLFIVDIVAYVNPAALTSAAAGGTVDEECGDISSVHAPTAPESRHRLTYIYMHMYIHIYAYVHTYICICILYIYMYMYMHMYIVYVYERDLPPRSHPYWYKSTSPTACVF